MSNSISFIGRVECFVNDQARVTLINEQTKEQLESECTIEILNENGIGEHDEFRCEVANGFAKLTRLVPKEISKEQLDEIRNKCKKLYIKNSMNYDQIKKNDL